MEEVPLTIWITYVVLTLVTVGLGFMMYREALSIKYLSPSWITSNSASGIEEDPFPEFSTQGPWWRRLISKFRRPWRTVEMGLGWDRGDDNSIFAGGDIMIHVTAPNGHTSQDEVQIVRVDTEGDDTQCTLEGQVLSIIDRWAWSAESEAQQSFRSKPLDEVGAYFVRYVVFPDGRPVEDISVVKEGAREAGYTLESLGPVLVRPPELAIPKAADVRWAETVEVDVKTLPTHHKDDVVELEHLGYTYSEVPEKYDGPIGDSVSSKSIPHPDKEERMEQTFRVKLVFSGKEAPQSPGMYRFIYRNGRSKKIWSVSKVFRVNGPYLDAFATETGVCLGSSYAGNYAQKPGEAVLSWGAPLTVSCISSQHHGSNDSIVLRRRPYLPTRNTTKPLSYPVTPLEWFSLEKDSLGDLPEEQGDALLKPQSTDQEIQLPPGTSHIRFKFGSSSKRKEEEGYTVIHERACGCRQPGYYYVLYVSSQTRHEETWFGKKPPKRIMGCLGPIVVTGPEFYPCAHSITTVPLATKLSVAQAGCSYYKDIVPHPFSPLMLRHSAEGDVVENCSIWWGSDVSAFCLWSKYRHSRQDRVFLQRIAELPMDESGSLHTQEGALGTKEALEYAIAKFLGGTTTSGCDVSALSLQDTTGKLLSRIFPVEKHGARSTVSSVNYASSGFGSSYHDESLHSRLFPTTETNGNPCFASVNGETTALVPFHQDKAPSLPGIYRFVYELHDPEEQWDTIYFGSAPFIVRGPEIYLGEVAYNSTDVAQEVDLATFWGEAVRAGVRASPFRNPFGKDYLALVPVIKSDTDSYRPVGSVQFSSYRTPINVNDKASSFPVVVNVPDPPGRTDDGTSCALHAIQNVYFEGCRAPPRPGLWQLVYYCSPTNNYTNVPLKTVEGQVLRVRGPSLHLSVVPHTYSEHDSDRAWFRWGKSEKEMNDETARKVTAAYEHSAPTVSVPPKVEVSFNTSPTHNQGDWIALCRVDGAPDDAVRNKTFKFVNAVSQGEFCFTNSDVPLERGEYQAVYVRGETGPGIWTAIGLRNQDPLSYIHTKHSLGPRDDSSARQQVASLYDVIARSKETFKIEADPNGRPCAIQEARRKTSVEVEFSNLPDAASVLERSHAAKPSVEEYTASSANVERQDDNHEPSRRYQDVTTSRNSPTVTSSPPLDVSRGESLHHLTSSLTTYTQPRGRQGDGAGCECAGTDNRTSPEPAHCQISSQHERCSTAVPKSSVSSHGKHSESMITGTKEQSSSTTSVSECTGTSASEVSPTEPNSSLSGSSTLLSGGGKSGDLLAAIRQQKGRALRTVQSTKSSQGAREGDQNDISGPKPASLLGEITQQAGRPVRKHRQASKKDTRPAQPPSLLEQIQKSGGKPTQLKQGRKRPSGPTESTAKSGPSTSWLDQVRKHVRPESMSDDEGSDSN